MHENFKLRGPFDRIVQRGAIPPLRERGEPVPTIDELKMSEMEREWWERARGRGALWYVVSKGLAFLILFPALGLGLLDWEWDASLLVEGWMVGLFWGAFFYTRKELRYRFTLEQEGLPAPDGWDD